MMNGSTSSHKTWFMDESGETVVDGKGKEALRHGAVGFHRVPFRGAVGREVNRAGLTAKESGRHSSSVPSV